MNAPRHRIGLVVPSSNTTLETEIPELLRRQQQGGGHSFTCHSARVRLQQVTPEALAKMNESADGAVDLLCDAQVDAIMYACLVAVMHGGRSSILETEARLAARAAGTDHKAPAIVTSAGALVEALQWLNASQVTLIAPYRKALTAKVAATLGECGIRVVQSRSLEVVDNLEVGRLDPGKLLRLASQLDFSGSDALVLSACVQMPSLDVIDQAERALGLPVISAATASVFALLNALRIEPAIDDAGTLLRSRDHSRGRAVSP
jgi:maleate isomerase